MHCLCFPNIIFHDSRAGHTEKTTSEFHLTATLKSNLELSALSPQLRDTRLESLESLESRYRIQVPSSESCHTLGRHETSLTAESII